ncbi:MAG: glycosyltransferase [Roseburia sp.]|nr:glycosyltransferase [Roseburia sp.]MCM1201646.1 glycosyltransferase [Bacteroides fragilis]
MQTENRKIYKILYFLDYGKYFGGAANTLLQQAVLMKRAGYSVMLFLSDYYGQDMERKYEEVCIQNGIEISYKTFQISSQPEDIDIICLDENYEALKEEIQKRDPDILHSVQINPIVELISRELDIPHIMNIYPLLPDFFSFQYMDIFPYYHICDSWYWAKMWSRYIKTDYVCIRTTVDKKAYIKPPFLLGEKVEYICVGDIYANKNQLNVIKAFHIALNKGINGSLSIYGHDNRAYADECRNYIRSNNLAGYIKIKGFCSNMKDVYRNSDVLICGSMRESYPNAISEAMAFGLVIISTPVAGVPETVKDGMNGYLTDDYTAEAISRKILEFHDDIGKEKLERVKKCEYDTFLKNHSSQVVTENLQKYYLHVVQDDKRKSDIRIADIREIFSVWKSEYYRNYDRFSDPQVVAAKLWYLFHARGYIESAIQNNAQFFIWGTGKYGKIVEEMVAALFPEVHIIGFLDSNRTGQFSIYKIYRPETILQKRNIIVFVAVVNGQDEIIKQLERNQFIYNRNYFILAPRAW